MTTTISLQEATKEQLDEVLADEGHTSQDSVVKSLLLYRDLYLQTDAANTTPSYQPTRTTTTTHPPSHHATNTNTAYIGKIGAGKTFTSKYHIHYQLEGDSDHDVLIIDPIGSYTEFTTRHGGTNITADDIIGNPFAFAANNNISTDTARTWGENAAVPFVLDVLTGRGFDYTDDEHDLLYERITGPGDTDTRLTLSNLANVRGPELPVTADRDVDQALINAIKDPDCPELTTEIVDPLPDDELVTIGLGNALAGGETTILGATLTAFAAAADRDDPVDLYIDNSHYLFATEHGKQIVELMLRWGRHHDVYLNFVTQTIDEFLPREPTTDDTDTDADAPGHDDRMTPSLLDQVETVFLHRMGDISEHARTALNLTEAEVAYIYEARTGVTSDHSEILVGTHGDWIPRRVQVSEDLQTLIDPDESF